MSDAQQQSRAVRRIGQKIRKYHERERDLVLIEIELAECNIMLFSKHQNSKSCMRSLLTPNMSIAELVSHEPIG
jgi:hypothetical protein